MSELAAIVESALKDAELTYHQPEPGLFGVELPGEQRLRTTCWLSVGEHGLSVEAFVMRKPDENREAVYRWLLHRNPRMYGVSWSVDDSGDVYLTGRIGRDSVTADEIDRVLGTVLDNADGSFNQLLKLGFASAIRREWAWRVKNNESLANLAAFSEFAQRSDDAD